MFLLGYCLAICFFVLYFIFVSVVHIHHELRSPRSMFMTNSPQLRLLGIVPKRNPTRPPPRKRGSPTHLLVVLGSGGHTAEMFSLLRDLDPLSYTYRSYVISSGDDFSAGKAIEFERRLEDRAKARRKVPAGIPKPFYSTTEHNSKSKETTRYQKDLLVPSPKPETASNNYDIFFVPRARLIHQSILTTPFSSLRCLIACIRVLRSPPPLHTYPDLIIINGPATSIILILASLLIRCFTPDPRTRERMRSIYVESWARVKGLSLSGRILVKVGACERVLVQWEGLQRDGVEFKGALIG